MLTAQNKETNEIVCVLDYQFAHELRGKFSDGDLVCPHCKEPVIIRQGKILHFEHPGKCGTPLKHQPTMIPHLIAKAKVFSEIKPQYQDLDCKIYLESPIFELNRIVDLQVQFHNGHRVIYECLMNPITPEEIQKRNEEAIAQRIDAIFLLGGAANNESNREWYTNNFGSCLYFEYRNTTSIINGAVKPATVGK